MNCDRWTSQGTNRSFNCSLRLTHERAVPVHSSSTDTQETQKGKENALPCTVSKPQPCGSSTQTYTHHLNVCFDRRPRWDHIWTTPNLWEFPFAFCWPSARCLKGERSHAWGHADHHVPFMIAIIYTHKKWSATSAQWQPSRMVGEMQRQVCPLRLVG